MKSIFKIIFFIMMVGTLAACASTQSGITLHIHSAKYLNPDINGNASPVVIAIYQLKSPFNFNNADYESLMNHNADILNSDLIDKQTTEIRPGQSQIISLNLSQAAHYLGIVVEFRNIDKAKWHSAIKLPNKAKNIKIVLDLETEGLTAYIKQ